MDKAHAFWEGKYEDFTPYKIKMDDESYKFLQPLILPKNRLQGKKVLEIGCGDGRQSIYLAKCGAIVTAVDNSENAVKNAKCMADYNNVSLNCFAIDAMEIDKLEDKFDFVVGRFVLHHIEPFDLFAKKMAVIMNKNGEGLFYENSSANKILMFCRTYFVGRFGIARDGDGIEIPFQKEEIKILQSSFRKVDVTFPKMVFFSMFSSKIFRGKLNIHKKFKTIDEILYKYLPIFNKWSYHQVIHFYK